MANVARRAAAAATLVTLLVGGAACSTEPETIRSYTPANGANVEVGTVKARGLAIVTSGGKGVLAGSLVSGVGDTLETLSAAAVDATGTSATPLQVQAGSIALPAGRLVALPEQKVGVVGNDLTPGLTARVTMTFAKSGTVSAIVPVVSADDRDWSTMTPKPGEIVGTSSTPTPSPAATPARSAAPTAAPTSPSETTSSATPTASATG